MSLTSLRFVFARIWTGIRIGLRAPCLSSPRASRARLSKSARRECACISVNWSMRHAPRRLCSLRRGGGDFRRRSQIRFSEISPGAAALARAPERPANGGGAARPRIWVLARDGLLLFSLAVPAPLECRIVVSALVFISASARYAFAAKGNSDSRRANFDKPTKSAGQHGGFSGKSCAARDYMALKQTPSHFEQPAAFGRRDAFVWERGYGIQVLPVVAMTSRLT
jgi:hypothetical protein